MRLWELCSRIIVTFRVIYLKIVEMSGIRSTVIIVKTVSVVSDFVVSPTVSSTNNTRKKNMKRR